MNVNESDMMDMITRKSLSIALVLFLILKLFAMGSPSLNNRRCKCANNCGRWSLHSKSVSMSNGCCSRTQGFPCHLQKDQTQEVPKSFTPVLKLERKKSEDINVALISENIKNNSLKSYCAQQIGKEIVRSAPIYLKDLPLLC